VPLRVLTISKPYVAATYRQKFAILSQDSQFEIGLICPKIWGQQSCEFGDKPTPYWFRTLDIRMNSQNHFHTYVGLADAIDAFRPDVLSVEEEHYSLVTAQAFAIARKRHIPTLFYTWQNIAKKYPPPFSWTERMVFRQAAVAIGGNQESLAILHNKGFSGVMREIPQMGVDIDLFAPKDSSPSTRQAAKETLGLDKDAFWIAYVGRLVEEKGIQILLEAAAQNRQKNVHLLILGDGPYGAFIRNKAVELGLTQRIRFVPFVPSVQVPHYLRAVDGLCLPSLTRPNWKEQFGRVLVEAMAAEAVVLGSSSGEIPNVIGDSGLVHNEGNVAALSAQLDLIAQNEDLVHRLRRKGADRVRANYTNRTIAAKFAEAFLMAACG
jgi:glycosyltransferase involved in cell wall biosynthesis